MKKIRRVGTPSLDSNNIDKNFLKETDDENCNCWRCEEQKDKKKIIKRQNSFLSNIVAFEK